jgi:hypothetical protein
MQKIRVKSISLNLATTHSPLYTFLYTSTRVLLEGGFRESFECFNKYFLKLYLLLLILDFKGEIKGFWPVKIQATRTFRPA